MDDTVAGLMMCRLSRSDRTDSDAQSGSLPSQCRVCVAPGDHFMGVSVTIGSFENREAQRGMENNVECLAHLWLRFLTFSLALSLST